MNKKEFIKKHWQVTWGFEHFDADLNAVIEQACKEQNKKIEEMAKELGLLKTDNERLKQACKEQREIRIAEDIMRGRV